MTTLNTLGWRADRAAHLAALGDPALQPARVVRVAPGLYDLIGEGDLPAAHLCGALLDHPDPLARPGVGDWVAVRDGVIHHVLPRDTTFVRKGVGRSSAPQLVCANVDVVLAVTTCGRDFNPRRLERYVAAIYGGGATPVIVLNKTDLVDDIAGRVEAAREAAPGVSVVALSALRDAALGPLAPFLAPGTTLALLGSSGVGKSTLVNRLLGEAAMAVGDVRGGDEKGRHTTTQRVLHQAPGDLVVIDTPGMRELGLWRADAGLADTFPDVEAAAASCRFRDCRHEGEPGCGVAAAIDAGELDADRVDSHRHLERELAREAARDDARLARAREARWKGVTRDIRTRRKLNRKLGLKDL